MYVRPKRFYSFASYGLLAELLVQWQQQKPTPVFYLPGNHDCPTMMAEAFAKPPFYAAQWLSLSGWLLGLLNTKGPTPAGEFDVARRSALALQLKDASTPVWLFCHHHPLPLNCFIDKHGQQHQAALWQAIANEPRIRGIAHGHAHYAYQRRWQQVDIVGCPASSVQFLPTADWQTSNAGPQWCDWLFSANGTVSWQFRRLDIM